MKRIITAVIFLAASPALAEMATQEEALEATVKIVREDPELFERLRGELNGGLTTADLICAEQQDCSPGDLMITPGGVLVRLSVGGGVYPVIEEPEVNQAVADEDTMATGTAHPEHDGTEDLGPVEPVIADDDHEGEAQVSEDTQDTAPDNGYEGDEADVQVIENAVKIEPNQPKEESAEVSGDEVDVRESVESPPHPGLDAPPLSTYKVPVDGDDRSE